MASDTFGEGTKRVMTFVLLGRPGSGKSRTGNTIIGGDVFDFGVPTKNTSRQCIPRQTTLFERSVCVIDTPGVFEIWEYEDLKTCIKDVGSSEIIFLICLPIGRITVEEISFIKQYSKMFGDSFNENTIIIFNKLDEWKSDMLDKNIEYSEFKNYIETIPVDILQCVQNRYLSLNNRQNKECEQHWRKKLMDIASSLHGFTLSDKKPIESIPIFAFNMSPTTPKQIEERMHHDITFVLLGNQGSGKSRTANTILGENAFEFGSGSQRTPRNCESRSTELLKRRICVIDTQGVSNFGKEEFEAINACLFREGSDKTIFLLCVPIGRLTEEERLLIKQYNKSFGEHFYENAIIIFTKLDEFESDNRDRKCDNPSFDSYVKSLPGDTIRILQLLNNRYLTVNNRQDKNEQDSWRNRLMDVANSINGFTMLETDTSGSSTGFSLKRIKRFANNLWNPKSGSDHSSN